MNFNEMSRKEFMALPERKWDQVIICTSLVLIPTRRKHDSGFRVLEFAACNGHEPICLLSGCSDVIHIDGIGGYGFRWSQKGQGIPSMINVHGWSMDCLWKSGLFRIWPDTGKIYCGPAMSSFEIFALEKDDKRKVTEKL